MLSSLASLIPEVNFEIQVITSKILNLKRWKGQKITYSFARRIEAAVRNH